MVYLFNNRAQHLLQRHEVDDPRIVGQFALDFCGDLVIVAVQAFAVTAERGHVAGDEALVSHAHLERAVGSFVHGSALDRSTARRSVFSLNGARASSAPSSMSTGTASL